MHYWIIEIIDGKPGLRYSSHESIDDAISEYRKMKGILPEGINLAIAEINVLKIY